MTTSHHVDPLQDGDRLDVIVASVLDISRSQAQKRIDDGLVCVDGAPALKSTRVEVGQLIEARPPSVVTLAPAPNVPVRWEDDDLLVVAKPADLVVHTASGVRGATMVDALVAQGIPLAPGEDPDRPGIVHRLDRGTSGLLVVAKTTRAMTVLKDVFRRHDVRREYWALVEGHPDPPAATIDAPIVRSKSNRTAFTTGDDGREAITHYATTAQHAGIAELEVTLETGRTHQVRVHMRAVGRPVAGDVLYGASAQIAKRLGLTRPALHARRLAFAHPVTGEDIDVTEDLPDDLAQARTRAAASAAALGHP